MAHFKAKMQFFGVESTFTITNGDSPSPGVLSCAKIWRGSNFSLEIATADSQKINTINTSIIIFIIIIMTIVIMMVIMVSIMIIIMIIIHRNPSIAWDYNNESKAQQSNCSKCNHQTISPSPSWSLSPLSSSPWARSSSSGNRCQHGLPEMARGDSQNLSLSRAKSPISRYKCLHLHLSSPSPSPFTPTITIKRVPTMSSSSKGSSGKLVMMAKKSYCV